MRSTIPLMERPDAAVTHGRPVATADADSGSGDEKLGPVPLPGGPEPGRSLRPLRFAFWGAALLLGAFDAFYPRFSTSPNCPHFPDAVSYIDIAATYARGDWAHALNGYWSPLYSWILAAALRILRPSASAEFPVVHLVNLIIFGAALGSFDYFWRAWFEDQQARAAGAGRTGWVSLPPWALLAIGYSLFAWTSIGWISVQLMSPDLLVAALVYLAAGLTLRLRRGSTARCAPGSASRPPPTAWVPARSSLAGTRPSKGSQDGTRTLPPAPRPLRSGGREGPTQWGDRSPGLAGHAPARPRAAALLGVVLGFGFLAKAVMLPLALVFMLVAFRPARNLRRAVPSLLAAGIAFLIVAAPFVGGLSRQRGRLTFGETGRLNYAWYVNGTRQLNWQGEGPGHWKPKHPTQLLYPKPPVYAFAGPIGGTYPLWTDPSYWYEGLRARFNGRQQARAVLKNLTVGRHLLPWSGAGSVLAGVLLVLLTVTLAAKRRLPALVRWDLLPIALAPMVLYSLVVVEARYLGAYAVLFWLALLPALRLPARAANKAAVISVTLLILLVPALGLARTSARDRARRIESHADWDSATALHAMGIHAGDRVGCVGLQDDLAWARLARVTVVAHIPDGKVGAYWRARPRVRAAVLRAFSRAGAKAVVTARPPAVSTASRWRRLGLTDRYARLLHPPTGTASRQGKLASIQG